MTGGDKPCFVPPCEILFEGPAIRMTANAHHMMADKRQSSAAGWKGFNRSTGVMALVSIGQRTRTMSSAYHH